MSSRERDEKIGERDVGKKEWVKRDTIQKNLINERFLDDFVKTEVCHPWSIPLFVAHI